MAIEIYFKGELLGRIEADALQDAFPWYTGRVVPTEKLTLYQEFFRWYSGRCEFPYEPFDPDLYEEMGRDDGRYPRDNEARYRQSDLYAYTEFLRLLQACFRAGGQAPALQTLTEADAWDTGRWLELWHAGRYDDAQFSAYLEFLDYRNWKITDGDVEVPWFSYPPAIDAETLFIAWR